MTGRAIVIVVVGIIIISGIVLYNIEAASTGIVANLNGLYSREVALNIASTGVNLALRQLAADRTWRAGFSSLALLNGKVDVSLFDTVFAGIPSNCIGIRSISTFNGFRKFVTAIGYFPPKIKPISVKSLITLHAANQINGNIVLDGRDHDINGNLLAGTGTYGIWTTGSSFTISGSGTVGGTAAGVDFAPLPIPNPAVIALNQPAAGYFSSIDSAFGGTANGYPPGTLMSIAKSGVAGSQYVTDPTRLQSPLSGVTYVDLPSGGVWQSPIVNGTGILIVHNSSVNAQIMNPTGSFKGIIVADDIVHLHGDVLGAIIGFTTSPSGNVIGNGNANILYSNEAILNATSFLEVNSRMNVVAWFE